jgi:hypothetical protein
MNTLKVGATKVDLEPPVGVWLTGYGGRIEPSQGRHDPIMARAVAVSDGTNTVIIVVCEVLGFDVDDASEMRHEIASRSDVPATNIIISATHTHSGPASMPMRGNMGNIDKKWLQATKEKVVEIACKAVKRLAPALMSFGIKEIEGIGYNRHPGGGPQDEMMRVMRFETPAGERLATLVNYATHAVVMGSQNLQLSGDFPGEVCRQIEKKGGVALYLQGCCGDIDPVLNRDRGWGKGTFEDLVLIGNQFVKAVDHALKNAEKTSSARIGATNETAKLPLMAPPDADEFATLKARLHAEFDKATSLDAKVCAKAPLEWAHALESSLQSGGPAKELKAEVTVLMIGEVRIVGLPFEPYTQIGLDIEQGLNKLKPMVVGYSNGLYGYCASDKARGTGGYGPGASHRWFPRLLTPFADGSAKALVDTAVHAAWNT